MEGEGVDFHGGLCQVYNIFRSYTMVKSPKGFGEDESLSMAVNSPAKKSPQGRRFSPAIFIVVACAILAFGGYLYLQLPKYLVLSIESPSSYLPRGGWVSTSYSTYEFPGSRDRYFVSRQETYVRMQESDPQSPFESTHSIFEYFDIRLQKDGWEFYDIFYGDPCILYLPEANFLPTGFDGYVAYRRPDANSYGTSPTVCLAVYPFSEGDPDTFYNVVLLTVNPSTLTAWDNQFELGWK